jgi:hypothetical protein
MRINRKLCELTTSSKEYKIYHLGLDPWNECFCCLKKGYKKKAGRVFRPYHNKAGNCRYGNAHKSWKNYRKTQYRESLR